MPRNGSLSPLPNLRAPSRSLMPYSTTMLRAIWVALSMSLAAAAGRLVEDQLLRGPAAEQHRQLVLHLGPGTEELVLGGQRLGV